MDISWLGHSCFEIKGTHATVITDPYPPDMGYNLGQRTADIITVSHQHPGHSYVKGVEGKPKLIKGPGEYEISDVLIFGMATYHDAENGQKLGKNTVYHMEIDGVAICHLGDLGHPLSSQQVKELGDIDVLLLPVGGVATINATTAAQMVRQMEPKIVIPMHYRTMLADSTLEPVDGFLSEMGLKEVSTKRKLTLGKTAMPMTTQVLVLQP